MKEERLKYWQSVVAKWQDSGLNKTEFCRQNHIDIPLFKYHSLKQHAYSQPSPKKSPKKTDGRNIFAEVICTAETLDSTSNGTEAMPQTASGTKVPLLLRLDCGGRIELTADFDAEILKRVLKIARDL